MTKLIYIIGNYFAKIIVLTLAFIAMAVLFVIALPIAGWNKSKFIFKRV